jgi:hypothetical protein
MKFVIWDWHLQFSGTRLVGIATWQQTGQSGVQILAGVKDFSLFQNIQIGSESNPASYPVGAGAHCWHKVPGAKVNL